MNTRIDASKIQALIQKYPDLKITPQSSFMKVESPNGYRLYPSKSSWVTRCDISGFVYPSGPGIVDLPPEKRPTGKVQQQIDFTCEESVILETLEAVLEFMVSLPKREAKKGEKVAKEAAKGWSFEATVQVDQPQA